MAKRRSRHHGGTLRDFLEEEGLYADVMSQAVKELLAEELTATMKRERITKTELARRLETSRSGLNRLLNPDRDTTLNLHTLAKAAETIGKRLHLEFRDV